MNIEIADRLCELRKKNKLSQEQLAEKIGVSRQAVSKWERAEASPDTDNLIALAEIYNVSIDEILTGKAINMGSSNEQADVGGSDFSGENNANSSAGYKKSNVSFKNGIDVDDNGEHVHIGFDGIHVHDRKGTKVSVDQNGVFVEENGETKAYTDENGNVYYKEDVKHNHIFCHDDEPYHKKSLGLELLKNVSVPMIAIIIFLVLGFAGLWYIAWIVFLAIPIIFSIPEAIEKRKPSKFCYPVLAVAIYLILGLVCSLWHPGWIIFLTIPLFYGVCSVFENNK